MIIKKGKMENIGIIAVMLCFAAIAIFATSNTMFSNMVFETDAQLSIFAAPISEGTH